MAQSQLSVPPAPACRVIIAMGYEESDPDLVVEVEEEMKAFIEAFENLRVATLLSEEYDKDNAIITLHA
ncbi:MAG TPA: hypothetical protein VHQ24_06530, partial [Lachnospiraceae bacterium]|nr:hypothetical protein [Lachnospiraceae bacterium]